MCGGMAARLTNDGFLDALQRLRRNIGLDTAQLVTFMSNSVAACLTDDGFMDALQRINREIGLNTAQLVTFMSNK